MLGGIVASCEVPSAISPNPKIAGTERRLLFVDVDLVPARTDSKGDNRPMTLARVLSDLSGDKTYEHVVWLTDNVPNRQSGSPNEHRAAEYFVERLIGFTHIPAVGVSYAAGAWIRDALTQGRVRVRLMEGET
jgi:hypothetical protein